MRQKTPSPSALARERGEKTYFTGRPCIHGHVAKRLVINGTCVDCSKQNTLKYYERPDRAEKRKKYAKEYHARNREVLNAASREYFSNHRIEATERRKQRQKSNPVFKLGCYLRSRVHGVLTGKNKNGSMIRDLGCSVSELKTYIESKFNDGMTWENWGKCWQLDHIRNLASFNLTNREQFLQASHFTNLQPLLIDDHKKKSASERSVLLPFHGVAA